MYTCSENEIVMILLMKSCMFMVLIQSQEGCGPGHQRGSSTGAAGLGHEPQSAHLPGPRCRAYPGEGNIPFSKLSFMSICLNAPAILFTSLYWHKYICQT